MSPARGTSCCPSCGHAKPTADYLCRTCWVQLPRYVRAALWRRDELARQRLRELYRQIQADVPLQEIEITP